MPSQIDVQARYEFRGLIHKKEHASIWRAASTCSLHFSNAEQRAPGPELAEH
ncbi:hypothetical protein [Streptomyces sp. ODS28]|uniref:hypothetical protein n=1 Tax=Streptomyces sp. ODS28 TaxID=3136688 RepID=UPI0031EFF9A7